MDNPITTFTFSSIIEKHDSTELPAGWLECDRKSTLIADKFLAFKTPLDDRFNTDIKSLNRWTCTMLIKNMKDNHKNLGLVIDLTDTDRYYLSNIEFIEKGIRYEKIRCDEDGEIPNDKQIYDFIRICHDFICTNPNDIIGVHCTYGYNQTGFFICAYLCQEFYYNIRNAIDCFKEARSPGIKKEIYLHKLIEKFDIKKLISTEIQEGPKPMFAVNHVDVIPVCSKPLLKYIRSKCQRMCGSNRQYFPGSKPISMNNTNYENIFKSPYMVSWKANGTRYMMLIEDENNIFMLDRNNDIFKINNLRFPNGKDFSKHLTDTLIDGEFVIDHDHGKNIYRYLVFDIITYEYDNVSQQTFHKRLEKIQCDIIDVRNSAMEKGVFDKNLQAFSIRTKQFWDLLEASTLLKPSFQSQITHGSDGLIFQSVVNPYQSGRSLNVIKWDMNNTVDFLLKIDRTGQLQNKRALLYLYDMPNKFASIPYSPELDKYDNQIIECLSHNDHWNFYRFRRDRKYPNTQATANGIIEASKHPIPKEVLYSLINESKAFDNYPCF